MTIPVGSMALAIPFHDLVMQKSCRAVRGRRGSVSGGVGGSVRGAAPGGSGSPFFWSTDRALPKLPPIEQVRCACALFTVRQFPESTESMRRGKGSRGIHCACSASSASILNERNQRER
ncbi:uncharacterized protein CEXT_276941 [Caerostris extrusa]|uniref:Uncharacterized protein n=1 Tax=Caerostris extrusa TaxID=172846 RepID=A0AAV4QWU3_CAEEX|nr:uncharacterized protein CEXT_276941 [Caerostris extrusa]